MSKTDHPSTEYQMFWTNKYRPSVSELIDYTEGSDPESIHNLIIDGRYEDAVKKTEAILLDMEAKGTLKVDPI
jgi:hypothetical protein